MIGILATIIVYVGFGFITEFELRIIKFPKLERTGIILLIVSNLLWITHFTITKDFAAIMWQAGFLLINVKWVLKG